MSDADAPAGSVPMTEDGVYIPERLRETDGQVVIRTPRTTIQHFSLPQLGPTYAMVRQDHFGPVESFDRGEDSLRNPHLVPNRMSVKHEGEDPVILEVAPLWTGGDDVPGSYLPAEVADE